MYRFLYNRKLPQALLQVAASPTRWASNVPFLLADIGEGIQEVEVLKWHVGIGDTLEQFDKVCEVQSDKAVVEITSRYAGVVTALADTEIVKVGQPLLHLTTDDDNDDAGDGSKIASNSSSDSSSASSSDDESVGESSVDSNESMTVSSVDDKRVPSSAAANCLQMSPAVRKLIHDHKIDVSELNGTGPNGRVLKADVLDLLEDDDGPTPSERKQESPLEVDGDTIIPLRGYTRIMFDSMTASLQRPHMSLTDELHVEQAWKVAPGIKFLSILIKAVSKGLEKYPALNAISKVDKKGTVQLTHKVSHNIGIAMDTASGLVVPVIHNVQELSVAEIQAQLDAYKEQTSFERSQLMGATFTLSNIGSTGAGLHATAVLGGDAVAMGVVGRKFVKSLYDGTSFVPTPTVMTSWTADHRFVDGASLAHFHRVVQGYVEKPTTLLVELR